MLGRFGSMLGPCWVIWWALWGSMEVSGGKKHPPNTKLFVLRVILGDFLGLCWANVGPFWVHVGPMLGHLVGFLGFHGGGNLLSNRVVGCCRELHWWFTEKQMFRPLCGFDFQLSPTWINLGQCRLCMFLESFCLTSLDPPPMWGQFWSCRCGNAWEDCCWCGS